jgi:FKBP-type peptidyl-prolyl cis-trans isomerase
MTWPVPLLVGAAGRTQATTARAQQHARARPVTPHTNSHSAPRRYYDVAVGEGPSVVAGDRAVVHFECKWRGITFVTSRQGVGVTGGEPYGFDVGATGTTKALKGLDYGVRGMRKGGIRKLIVPPALGYGEGGARPPLPHSPRCFGTTAQR